jgi:hypothetical protein
VGRGHHHHWRTDPVDLDAVAVHWHTAHAETGM